MTDHSHDNWKPASNPWAVVYRHALNNLHEVTGGVFRREGGEARAAALLDAVDRVPVKIVIDKGLDPNKPLPLGLSVEPKVTVE
jgi:membrane fusion protein (multidrug efflux system)